jgi:hypothetical protein
MIVHGLQAGIYGGVPALSMEQRHHALILEQQRLMEMQGMLERVRGAYGCQPPWQQPMPPPRLQPQDHHMLPNSMGDWNSKKTCDCSADQHLDRIEEMLERLAGGKGALVDAFK